MRKEIYIVSVAHYMHDGHGETWAWEETEVAFEEEEEALKYAEGEGRRLKKRKLRPDREWKERLKKYGYAGFEREWGSYAREAADINITSCSLIRKGRKK